jgi:ribosome-binding factor A
MSESKRQLKFSKLIQEEISDIYQRRFQGSFAGSLVTVSDVEMSPDLSFAKIFVSVFPSAQTGTVMEKLNEDKSQIRGDLGRRIGKNVRIIPEIAFFSDATAEEADRIDKIIDDLVIPPKKEQD